MPVICQLAAPCGTLAQPVGKLAYFTLTILLTMQHYKALLLWGPYRYRPDRCHHFGFCRYIDDRSHHSTNELAAASFVNNMFTLAIIFATGSHTLADSYRRESVRTKGETHVVGRMLKEQPVCQLTLLPYCSTHHVDTLSEYPPTGTAEEPAAFNASLLLSFC